MPSLAAILKRYLPDRTRLPVIPHNANRSSSAETLRPVGLEDFPALEIPPRTMLLDPILPERSLSMLFAPRGIGKSWLGLSIGLAVASGCPLLRWTAPRPRHVLHIDGEMQLADLQSRLGSIRAGMGVARRSYSPSMSNLADTVSVGSPRTLGTLSSTKRRLCSRPE